MTKIEEVQMTRKVLRRPYRRSLGGEVPGASGASFETAQGVEEGRGGGKLASRATIISLL